MRQSGDVFTMHLTKQGAVRENHVVEFEEGRRIAWLPAPVGQQPPGHLWRWELEPLDGGTLVRHTYDGRSSKTRPSMPRARETTEASLRASIDRLAELAERQ